MFPALNVLGQTIGNVNALRAKRPVHERHAPRVSETQLLLQTIRNEDHPRILMGSNSHAPAVCINRRFLARKGHY